MAGMPQLQSMPVQRQLQRSFISLTLAALLDCNAVRAGSQSEVDLPLEV